MNIGIFCHPGIDVVFLKEFVSFLKKSGHEVTIFGNALSEPEGRSQEPGEIIAHADLIVSVGGDGTFLRTARYVGDKEKPILGVHLGGLGFLADVSPENYKEKFTQYFAGDYKIEKRSVLASKVRKNGKVEKFFAFNDFVVDKGSSLKMIKIKIFIDGEFLNTYRADGLIVSTPTGSTAYNLSAGGPIIFPCLDVITINPICPHTLSARPLVISDIQEIKVKLEDSKGTPFLSIDGQIKTELDNRTEIIIQKAEFHLKLVRFKEDSFFKTLRAKLNWGKDVRSN